ncbi:MAG: TIM-barrel domain-containing protein [Candidatus Zhuqueibacterota bacterium]
MPYVLLSSLVLIFLFFGFVQIAHGQRSDSSIIPVPEGFLKIQICSPGIVRVIFAEKKSFLSRQSLIANEAWTPVNWTSSRIGEEIVFETELLKIEVNAHSGVIQFRDSSGAVLLREQAPAPHRLTPARVLGEKTWHAESRFQLSGDEGLYGLGQYQDGVMNYRGHDVLLVQANKVAVIPFLVSTNNYGILWDNYSRTMFHDGDDGMSFWSEVADQIDYYFVAGKKMDEVIAGYRRITGQAPLLGKWAYGYWQSKERYVDRKELLATTAEYRRRNIPIDNMVQDWRYWGENEYWSSMEWDESIFPNPAEMIQLLHEKYHVHLMVSIWPMIGKKTALNKELKSKGYLFDNEHWAGGDVYDAYSEEARDIYFKHVKKGLLSVGVDALWMDATEPEFPNTDTQEITEKEIKDCGRNAMGTMARYLNTYSYMTTKGAYEDQRRFSSQKRVFTLTRSAFAGQQKFAAGTWSGDISANWDVFRKQISAGINFCMAGIPYWSHDIGAFFPSGRGGLYNRGVDDPAYRELYVRWFQFGAFTPIFRSHGTGTPREVWRFGEPGDWAYDSLVKFDHLRYRLLPYIYSIAWQITHSGYTLMRGLAMDFPDDRKCYAIDNQFMFGPAILAMPVTEAMYYEPQTSGDVIPTENLFSPEDAPGGLVGHYFKGVDFDELVNTRTDSCLDFNWCGGAPAGCPASNYSIRWHGFLLSNEAGDYEIGAIVDDGVRVWLNDQLIIDSWKCQGVSYYSHKLTLAGNTKYAIKVEYFQGEVDALFKLVWKTPTSVLSGNSLEKEKSSQLYLPETKGWFDFWTGEKIAGGKAITRETPIDIMPLYIKAGSILPLGPFKQYSDETPEEPIELRIYPGSDAEFTLYEDENDTYNYERGVYATIPFRWNEKEKTLIIGKRQGAFPGMLTERTFNIVWVGANHGVGVEECNEPDEVVMYAGEEVVIIK